MFETCAGCHSHRAEITGDAVPGDSYWDHYLLTIVEDSDQFFRPPKFGMKIMSSPLFWAAGCMG
jgi:mono/diheme cytochrome c family protein